MKVSKRILKKLGLGKQKKQIDVFVPLKIARRIHVLAVELREIESKK